jgi:transglutaminase-like putative cysteine protease
MQLALQVHLDYAFAAPTDVLLQLEPAALPDQRILDAALTLAPHSHTARISAQDGLGERLWLRPAQALVLDYSATIAIDRAPCRCAGLPATPLHRLPAEVVPYLLPSRYCPSDLFETLAAAEFGHLHGGARVLAIRDWIATHFTYTPAASGPETTALESHARRAGVCRDYAHVLIALARAGGIPARFASVYAPNVTPPDFHAVAQIYLDGAWHLLDATGMAAAENVAVIGVGRDAADVAFLTAFGFAEFRGQSVRVTAL